MKKSGRAGRLRIAASAAGNVTTASGAEVAQTTMSNSARRDADCSKGIALAPRVVASSIARSKRRLATVRPAAPRL